MDFSRLRTRLPAFILFLALLASLVVAFERVRVEQSSKRVELAMDYTDFLSLARAYNYDPEQFLVQLRRAGLTSLALTEELGSNIGNAKNAYVNSGVGILDAARLSPLANPTLAKLVASGRIQPNAVYLLVYDRQAFDRYMAQLPLHFERSGIHVLHDSLPYLIGVRTQMDYFGSTALGVPKTQIALARKLHFFVIPRFQNDERLTQPQMERMFTDLDAGKWVSTVIFFGLRNQVLGYPDHVQDAANVFKAHRFNYGEIETYNPAQIQKGNVELARLIPGRTVRVQAISKLELDKLTVPQIVARYELGVRERNVRVVYLRPFAHQYNGRSIEQSNVEMVKEIAGDLRAHGFRLGRATPIPLYHGNSPVLVGIAALAVPSIFVLLLLWCGWYRPWLGYAAYALTIAVYLGGYASHHDILGRSIVALIGALLFATAAFTILSRFFRQETLPQFWLQVGRSIGVTLAGTGVALLGALVVIGVLSSPLLMEEVDTFRGVKLVLALPPLIALLLYLLTDRFDAQRRPGAAFVSPVQVYQLVLAAIVIGVGALVLVRSGNQSEVAPSAFELALRHHLTDLLSVRPRFKEFVIGFPFLMLMPALTLPHRRAVGVLLALGIGVGLGDVIDTFSHLHTPVLISIERIVNGLVLGIIIGAIAIAIYRAVCARYGAVVNVRSTGGGGA